MTAEEPTISEKRSWLARPRERRRWSIVVEETLIGSKGTGDRSERS